MIPLWLDPDAPTCSLHVAESVAAAGGLEHSRYNFATLGRALNLTGSGFKYILDKARLKVRESSSPEVSGLGEFAVDDPGPERWGERAASSPW